MKNLLFNTATIVGISLSLSALSLACWGKPNETCQGEGRRICVEGLNRSFKVCKFGHWHDGSCDSTQFCHQGLCLAQEPCTAPKAYCENDSLAFFCQPGERLQAQQCQEDERCHEGRCLPKDSFNCPELGILSPEELRVAFQRNDEHCGACRQACQTAQGQYCVLGQCIKTRCAANECHAVDGEGRLFCEPCLRHCPNKAAQDLDITVVYEEADKQALTADNTSAEAYLIEGKWLYKRLQACGCKRDDGSLTHCDINSDRCVDGNCHCADKGRACSPGLSCVDGQCEGSCDGVNACAAGALCKQGRCLCEGSNALNMHCNDSMLCVQGNCLCAPGGVVCGAESGDWCEAGRCLCGPAKRHCPDEKSDRCVDGRCVCGDSSKPCDNTADRCQNGHCRCGFSPPCGPGMHCLDGQCLCLGTNRRCLPGESCNAQGHCVCGNQGSCNHQYATHCQDGACHCAKDLSCEAIGARCTPNGCACGTRRACKQAAQCQGSYCACSDNTDCHDDEVCGGQSILKHCRCLNGEICPPGTRCMPQGCQG